MRTAEIYVFTRLAGSLTENDDGRFVFLYDASYLQEPSAIAISNPTRLADIDESLRDFLVENQETIQPLIDKAIADKA